MMAIKDDYHHISSLKMALTLCVIFFSCCVSHCLAQGAQADVRARLSDQSTGTLSSVRYSPVMLQGGAKLTIVSPERWSDISMALTQGLVQTHQRFTKLLGDIPPFNSAVRLMDEDTFYITTGAPRWTNAMYFRGEIIIPLSSRGAIDSGSVMRSLRHEYTHAVLNALSKGRCPGWLDEGLAQWAEGEENPALRPALFEWLSYKTPVSLRLLQGGFTRLDPDMVAAAYAQSLFAANTVVNTFGFSPLGNYLSKLREGVDREAAFQSAFNLSESDFEAKLGKALVKWSSEYHSS